MQEVAVIRPASLEKEKVAELVGKIKQASRQFKSSVYDIGCFLLEIKQIVGFSELMRIVEENRGPDKFGFSAAYAREFMRIASECPRELVEGLEVSKVIAMARAKTGSRDKLMAQYSIEDLRSLSLNQVKRKLQEDSGPGMPASDDGGQLMISQLEDLLNQCKYWVDSLEIRYPREVVDYPGAVKMRGTMQYLIDRWSLMMPK